MALLNVPPTTPAINFTIDVNGNIAPSKFTQSKRRSSFVALEASMLISRKDVDRLILVIDEEMGDNIEFSDFLVFVDFMRRSREDELILPKFRAAFNKTVKTPKGESESLKQARVTAEKNAFEESSADAAEAKNLELRYKELGKVLTAAIDSRLDTVKALELGPTRLSELAESIKILERATKALTAEIAARSVQVEASLARRKKASERQMTFKEAENGTSRDTYELKLESLDEVPF